MTTPSADEWFAALRPRLKAVHLQDRAGGWAVALVVAGHYRGRDEAVAKAAELQALVDRIANESEMKLYRASRAKSDNDADDQHDSGSPTPETRATRRGDDDEGLEHRGAP